MRSSISAVGDAYQMPNTLMKGGCIEFWSAPLHPILCNKSSLWSLCLGVEWVSGVDWWMSGGFCVLLGGCGY